MLGQAWEFQVIGIRPSAESVILGNPWSSRACERFITLVKGQALIASLYSIVQGVLRVELHINLETTDKSVADILIEEGHALKAEESYVSVVTQRITHDCCCCCACVVVSKPSRQPNSTDLTTLNFSLLG